MIFGKKKVQVFNTCIYILGLTDLKVEDNISLKVVPVLPALNCALLEAKKSFSNISSPGLTPQNGHSSHQKYVHG